MSIADLLTEAAQLQATGHALPAGLLLRIVLERWLHAAAFAARPDLSGRNSIVAYAEVLKGEGLIDSDAFASIRAAGKELNRVAHGKPLTSTRAGELLALVRNFVSARDQSCQTPCSS
jgi:hypothetical protein